MLTYGTLCAGVVLCVCATILSINSVKIFCLFGEINEIRAETIQGMHEFQEIVNVAWKDIVSLRVEQMFSNVAKSKRDKRYATSSQCDTRCRSSAYECPIGRKGTPGEPGTDGVPGLPGMPGAPGKHVNEWFTPEDRCVITCHAGPPGPPGKRGPIGFTGLDGESGTPGTAGLLGAPGLPGSKGNPGPAGESGQTGEVGAPGIPAIKYYYIPGSKGVRGPPGEQGPRGKPGERGLLGPTGQIGFPGLRGPKGLSGKKGMRGRIGQVGIPGKDGGYCRCPPRYNTYEQLPAPSSDEYHEVYAPIHTPDQQQHLASNAANENDYDYSSEYFDPRI